MNVFMTPSRLQGRRRYLEGPHAPRSLAATMTSPAWFIDPPRGHRAPPAHPAAATRTIVTLDP
jgi:hypothetical protein